MPRTLLDHAVARVAAARAEIARIRTPDFPLAPGKGLELIDSEFVELQKTLLEDLDTDNDPEAVKAVAESTLEALEKYLPLIGFMLRATNVRNAFELNGPLLRMARQILGSDTRVVVSSEWEFSPFTYRSIVELPKFVLIGMPASESGNGLIVPLAGHELGHAIYERKDLRSRIEGPVADALVAAIEKRWTEYSQIFPDLEKDQLGASDGRDTWEPFFDWAIDQCEESFCDFFGLRLFSESYLQAFAYLLAPCLRYRSTSYPSMTVRVDNMIQAAAAFGIPVPPELAGLFRDSREDFLPPQRLFCAVADSAVAVVVPSLIDEVKALATELGLPDRDDQGIKAALRDFQTVIPARNASSLPTIANAGWAAYHDLEIWDKYPDMAKRKQEVLNDLVLKSAEILEISQRLTEGKHSA
ncbi:MAG TPA: hypothetical protein VKT78_10350 [Fimbriimonadaceae bacterium]|nr:hypothetical protein [Fimbriimonadaceae bacterium]